MNSGDMRNIKTKLTEKKWYPYAVAASIGAAVFVTLTHLDSIWAAIGTFFGYFEAIFLGCVIAYLINPLARVFRRTVFKRIKKEGTGWSLSVALSFIAVIIILLLLLLILIPQLVESISTFVGNIDSYLAAMQTLLSRWNLDKTELWVSVEGILESSGSLLKTAAAFVTDNISSILSTSANIGKSVLNWGIALILSIYLLSAKSSVKEGAKRLTKAVLPEKRYLSFTNFLRRCDSILVSYISYSLIDAVIVGVLNAVFMAIAGIPYVGLITVLVAVTNLIPNFGPIIGAVIGAFLLLLVKPWYAVAFLIFTLVLQTCDAYIIKPRLFGGSLGVSGLLLLISIVVCGNIFGIVGILLAIPIAAILDFVYKDILLPALERKKLGKREE